MRRGTRRDSAPAAVTERRSRNSNAPYKKGQRRLQPLRRPRFFVANKPVRRAGSVPDCSLDSIEEAEPVQTVVEESRAEGTIGVSLYVKFLRAGASIFTLLVVLLVNLLAQVAYIMQDWWLAYWADEQEKLGDYNSTIIHNGQNITKELDTAFYLGVYGGLTAAVIVFGFMRNLLLFNVLVRCAQALHNCMFNSILRTPVRFFDINPIGRVLNRFSKDIGQLDSNLPWTFVDFIQVRTDVRALTQQLIQFTQSITHPS
ncbi:ATP-binding cassette sub-family C member 4 [Lates calcarifer]|uniref:ATP-binding cassette sub-family C member 4 n=1 Tax=Lates calcarifer TaxID=8187 RepID=A0AAJ8DL53_LATCA|nr:ATP-binding cassette sub-family C member 4 [Lates calcarifer]